MNFKKVIDFIVTSRNGYYIIMNLFNPYHSYPKSLFLFEDLKSLSTVSLETQYGNEVKPIKIATFG